MRRNTHHSLWAFCIKETRRYGRIGKVTQDQTRGLCVLCTSGAFTVCAKRNFPATYQDAEREMKTRAEVFERDGITHGGAHERRLSWLRVSSIKWPERSGFKVDGCARFIFDASLSRVREPTISHRGVCFSCRVTKTGTIRIISFIRCSPWVASPVYSLRARLIADHLLSYPYARVRVRVYVRAWSSPDYTRAS